MKLVVDPYLARRRELLVPVPVPARSGPDDEDATEDGSPDPVGSEDEPEQSPMFDEVEKLAEQAAQNWRAESETLRLRRKGPDQGSGPDEVCSAYYYATQTPH